MLRFISYILMLIVGFALSTGWYYSMPHRTNQLVLGRPATEAPATPVRVAGSGPGTTVYAVQKLEPSVVNIDITGRPMDAPAQEDPFGFGGPMGMPQEVVPQGQASGVIISADGYILTNNHVASEASKIQVTLHDGRKFPAAVVGLDPRSDLAVIKINANGLTPAAIANSKNVQLGQSVIAVGNPLGIGTTATSGIISAIRSPFQIRDKIFPEILQTDAAINPGNSGGALADLNGDLIGINTAIASTGGGSIGIGFAIPAVLAVEHARQLIQSHSVTYPWLGISYLPQSQGDPNSARGVLVRAVLPNSPAAAAGIQRGDVITRIDDHAIDEPEKVNYLVQQHQPGDRATVSYSHAGDVRTVQVTLGRMPNMPETAPSAPPMQP